jgi:hypothetical protein
MNSQRESRIYYEYLNLAASGWRLATIAHAASGSRGGADQGAAWRGRIGSMAQDDERPATGLDRRRLMRGMGMGVAAIGAASAAGLVGTAQATNQGAGPPDGDIFNFALNLEYLEAEFYLFATTGHGLTAADRTGTGTQGSVSPGAKVHFRSEAVEQYAQRIATDEQNHVRFIRAVLGVGAVAEPAIDVGIGPNSSFSKLAVAAGLIHPGQVFNPYADDVSFLLGASIFEDVGVTAYAGAARYIGNPNYLTAAAGILAVEAYHAGAVRSLLADVGAGEAFDKISNLRKMLSGANDDVGIRIPGNHYNFVPVDANSLVFTRTTTQVLNIVYGGGAASGNLFFPNKLNGNIS